MKALKKQFRSAIAAAESLSGKRFNLLVASSLVVTAAIVASALTGTGDNGALAALLGQRSAGSAAEAPAPAPESGPATAGGSGEAAMPAPLPSGALVSEAPAPAPPRKKAPPPTEPTAAGEKLPEAGRIKHVFVISLASSGYDAAFGSTPQMPYLSGTLRPQGELLSDYTLLDDAALPNGIALISGQPPNAQTKDSCPTFGEFPANSSLAKSGVVPGDGCVFPVEVLTLADQLVGGRFRWGAYMEGMVDENGKPDTCVHPDFGGADEPAQGGYAARHNPFVHFHSLLDVGDCAENDKSLSELEKDLRTVDTTPNFSYISPNLCNAGVAGQCAVGAPDGVASADAFLSKWVPTILGSPAYEKAGLLIVTFGELNPLDPASGAPLAEEKPKVGALLLSRFVSPGATDSTPYDPYSLLRTFEDLFDLDHLGLAGGTEVKSLATRLLGVNQGD